MKIAVLIARVLLGLAFLIFGANILFPFIPMKPQPPSDGTTLAMIMTAHKWMAFVGLIQVVGGLLLLVGRFIPFALTILAPVLVNILLFHLLLENGSGIIPGAVLAVLELFLLAVYRNSFIPLFHPAPEVL